MLSNFGMERVLLIGILANMVPGRKLQMGEDILQEFRWYAAPLQP